MLQRMKKLSFFVLILISLLIARLVQIQLLETESFSKRDINLIEESVNQRVNSYILNEGRGTFLDRDGNPLLEHKYELVIFPHMNHANWPLEKMAQMSRLSPAQLRAKIMNAHQPIAVPLDATKAELEKFNALKIPGVYAAKKRDDHSRFAQHIIGLTGQNAQALRQRYPELLQKGIVKQTTKIGLNGLEKAFDPFLISDGEAKLNYHVDNRGRPLLGLDVKYVAPSNPFYPLQVKTTIDKQIQAQVEKALDEATIENGGAVLLDVSTNEVLALASRPTFAFDNPFERGAVNEMIRTHVPGSVFKMVTATAAIEQGMADDERTYNCDLDLYGERESDRQLGMLSFADSFAQSCNRTFAELANELMRVKSTFFADYAHMLSLTEKSGWSGDVYHFEDFQQLPDEEQNRIWTNDDRGEKAVAQTSVGQLNVRLTPLSVANMMATIARDGEKKQVKLVSELLYKQGSSVLRFPEHITSRNTMKAQTAAQLQDLLRQVVKHPKGTGFARELDQLPYQVAGKSGTAQKNHKEKMNQWFAGFFPYEDPKYALVVVDLNHENGDQRAYEGFRSIVTSLYHIDKAK